MTNKLGGYKTGPIQDIDNPEYGLRNWDVSTRGTKPTTYGGLITFKIDYSTKLQVAFGWDTEKATIRRYLNNAWENWTDL